MSKLELSGRVDEEEYCERRERESKLELSGRVDE